MLIDAGLGFRSLVLLMLSVFAIGGSGVWLRETVVAQAFHPVRLRPAVSMAGSPTDMMQVTRIVLVDADGQPVDLPAPTAPLTLVVHTGSNPTLLAARLPQILGQAPLAKGAGIATTVIVHGADSFEARWAVTAALHAIDPEASVHLLFAQPESAAAAKDMAHRLRQYARGVILAKAFHRSGILTESVIRTPADAVAFRERIWNRMG